MSRSSSRYRINNRNGTDTIRNKLGSSPRVHRRTTFSHLRTVLSPALTKKANKQAIATMQGAGAAASRKEPPDSGGPMPVRFGGPKCPPPALGIDHPAISSREEFPTCGDVGTFRVLEHNLDKRYCLVEATIAQKYPEAVDLAEQKHLVYWYLDEQKHLEAVPLRLAPESKAVPRPLAAPESKAAGFGCPPPAVPHPWFEKFVETSSAVPPAVPRLVSEVPHPCGPPGNDFGEPGEQIHSAVPPGTILSTLAELPDDDRVDNATDTTKAARRGLLPTPGMARDTGIIR